MFGSLNLSLDPSMILCIADCVLQQLKMTQYTMHFRTCGKINHVKRAEFLMNESFPVTESLENSLKHAHLQGTPCALTNAMFKERGDQIHLMKEIYYRSRILGVWINMDLPLDNPGVRKLLSLQLQGTVDQLGDDPELGKQLLSLLPNSY